MEKPVGKEYAGPSGVGRESIWLTAEDLVDGRDVTVKIDKVVLYPMVKFEGGREKLNMLGLSFAGKDRVLGLNATNRKTLNRMFGNITSAWKGQEITLFVSQTQFAGETVKCVRIRDRGSRAASAAEEFLTEDREPEAETGPRAGGAPTSSADQPVTDEALFAEFTRLAHKVSESFGGERALIKEAPKKSGAIWTCDPELADPEIQLYHGSEKRLAVPRERLSELARKLEGMLT